MYFTMGVSAPLIFLKMPKGILNLLAICLRLLTADSCCLPYSRDLRYSQGPPNRFCPCPNFFGSCMDAASAPSFPKLSLVKVLRDDFNITKDYIAKQKTVKNQH